jgi:cob(I)alamin adenosyltransferase
VTEDIPVEFAETQQERMKAAASRIQRVCTRIDTFNQMLPLGAAFNLPVPQMEAAATVDTLVAALIDAGVLDEADLVVRKNERMAGLFEEAWEASREQRQNVSRQILTRR